MATGPAVMTLGSVAAICTTAAFLPQIQKIRKTGGKDVSYPMLLLYLIGVTLWLAYGVAIGAAAVIWANAVSIALVGSCLALKRMKEKNVTKTIDKKKLRIAIDMDETIADSLKEHIRRYNAASGENLTAEQLRGKHVEDAAPADQREVVGRMVHDESFFENLEVLEGAREVIRELAREHEVFIVSAAMEVPESFAAKHRWLGRHFAFIPTSNVVFCGDKGIIDADYLIDDRARHFRGFRGTGLLFSAPHNAEEKGYRRVESWEEVRTIFLGGRARKRLRRRMPSWWPPESSAGSLLEISGAEICAPNASRSERGQYRGTWRCG